MMTTLRDDFGVRVQHGWGMTETSPVCTVGRIKSELAIDLPYPRHYTVKTTPRFSELKAQVTEDIRVETLRAVQMER